MQVPLGSGLMEQDGCMSQGAAIASPYKNVYFTVNWLMHSCRQHKTWKAASTNMALKAVELQAFSLKDG